MHCHITTEHLNLFLIFYFILCINVSKGSWISSTNDSPDKEENSNAEIRFNGKFSEVKPIDESTDLNEYDNTLNEQFTDDLDTVSTENAIRHKRSTYFDISEEYPSLWKRIQTDYGYGSRLLASRNLAQFSAGSRLFGAEGPGKRSVEEIDILDDNEQDAVDKRMSDYGYGSRLRAGTNLANSMNKNSLFGLYGPGKRSYSTDFGYGSRNQALENVAASLSRGSLFGLHGPGKRSLDDKRIATDYGYGSRINAADNLAKGATSRRLFSIYGPGKRSIADSHTEDKRIVSDFGYGSRERMAESLAQSADKDKIFGVFGPGKRGDVSPGSGYGERIGAGSQIAKDMTAIYDLYSKYGPGR